MDKKTWVSSLEALGVFHFVDKLEAKEPFSFARYGDGEWFAIFGGRHIGHKNSNGCTFTPQLSNALRQVLDDGNPYMHGTLRIAHRKLGGEIGEFLAQRGCNIHWYRGDVLLDQMLKGNLWTVVQALQKKRILMVGPKHLRGLNKNFFQYVDYIQPPPINSLLARDTIVPAVLKSIKQNHVDVVGWAAGLATKVFINDVYKQAGDDVTQIDFGSMFDGYFGIGSRTYVRRGQILWKDLLRVNTGQREKLPRETFRRKPRRRVRA